MCHKGEGPIRNLSLWWGIRQDDPCDLENVPVKSMVCGQRLLSSSGLDVNRLPQKGYKLLVTTEKFNIDPESEGTRLHGPNLEQEVQEPWPKFMNLESHIGVRT